MALNQLAHSGGKLDAKQKQVDFTNFDYQTFNDDPRVIMAADMMYNPSNAVRWTNYNHSTMAARNESDIFVKPLMTSNSTTYLKANWGQPHF